MSIDLQPGDEIVVSRRRARTVKDDEGKDQVVYEVTEMSKVALQADPRLVVGGAVEDRWIDNKRFIEIRLETRAISG